MTSAPLVRGPSRRHTDHTHAPVPRDSVSLYVRVLGLRHLRPASWQRALFVEGSVAVAAVLALADLASAWLIVVLPVSVAFVVKFHDLVVGALRRPTKITGPARRPAPTPAAPLVPPVAAPREVGPPAPPVAPGAGEPVVAEPGTRPAQSAVRVPPVRRVTITAATRRSTDDPQPVASRLDPAIHRRPAAATVRARYPRPEAIPIRPPASDVEPHDPGPGCG